MSAHIEKDGCHRPGTAVPVPASQRSEIDSLHCCRISRTRASFYVHVVTP